MHRTRITAGILALAVAGGAVAAIRPVLFQDMPVQTKQHKMLQATAGIHEGTITMLMPGVPAEPIPATEVIENFGDFWSVSEFKCDFMGMPFTGRGAIGYDPAKGKFIGTWMDSMSPTLAIMEGEYDEAKKAIVMNWEAPDMTGAVVPHRSVTIHTAEGYTMEMFQGEGELVKTMEIKMKRTKKPVEAGADK